MLRMFRPAFSLLTKVANVAGIMTGAAVVVEGVKFGTKKLAPSLHPVIAGPLNKAQSMIDPLDMGGFQKRRAEEAKAAELTAGPAPVISGAETKRKKVALKVIKARQKAAKQANAQMAMLQERWADLTEEVSDMSEKLEAQGNDKSAEALAAVALKLAENAKSPPQGPQEDLAAPGLTDRIKSIVVDMFDMVHRTTEEPDFSSIAERLADANGDDDDDDDDFGSDPDEDDISEPIDPAIDEAMALDIASDMTDHTFDGQLSDVAGPDAKPAGKTKTAGKADDETRPIVAGCCSSCSMGKGSCSSIAGDGVPGELIDGDIEGLFGPAVDDIDLDDIRDTDDDDFTEDLGLPADIDD